MTIDTMSKKIKQELYDLADTYAVLPDDIGNDNVIPDLGILDSQGIISFIVWIESEFDVIIPTDEVNLDNLGTINCIIDYIAKKNNESK